MASKILFNKRKNKLYSNTILFKFKNRNRRKFFNQILYLLPSSESSIVSLVTSSKAGRTKTLSTRTQFFNESSDSGKSNVVKKSCSRIQKRKDFVKTGTRILFQKHRWKYASGFDRSSRWECESVSALFYLFLLFEKL